MCVRIVTLGSPDTHNTNTLDNLTMKSKTIKRICRIQVLRTPSKSIQCTNINSPGATMFLLYIDRLRPVEVIIRIPRLLKSKQTSSKVHMSITLKVLKIEETYALRKKWNGITAM